MNCSGVNFLIIVFAICSIVTGCQQKIDKSKSTDDLIYIPEIHADNKLLYQADSCLFFQNDSLALRMFQLAEKQKNLPKNISTYIQSRLLNLTLSLDKQMKMYERIQQSEHHHFHFLTKSEITKFELNNKKELTFLKDLNTSFQQSKVNQNYKGQIAYLMARYHDERKNDLDSAWHFIMLSKGAFEQTGKITPAYQDCLEKITAFCTYKRKNLLAIRYANAMFDFERYLPKADTLDKARALANRAFMMFREGDFNDTEEDIKRGLSLINPEKNPELYQNLMKSVLVIHMLKGQDSLWHSAANEMMSNIHKTGQDYIEMNRWYGQYYNSQGKYSKAIPYLKIALDTEIKRSYRHSARLSTLCFLLSQCYENLKNYDEALNYIATNIGIEKYSDKALLEYLNIDRTYPFVAVLRCAEIYHSKYLSSQNIDYIQKSKNFLDRIDEVIFTQFKVMDENAILQFYLESGKKHFELGMDVNYTLWEKTKNSAYLHAFVNYSDKHKNSLLYRDKQMAERQINIPEQLLQQEFSLRSAIKEERRNGLRDNLRFNGMMDQYETIESDIQKANKKFITHGLVTEKLDIGATKSLLNGNQSLLSVDESKEQYYFTVINTNDVHVAALKKSPHFFQKVDSMIAHLQNPEKEYGLTNKTSLVPSPIQSKLRDTIFFVADGLFHRFPLASVLDKTVKKIINLPTVRLLKDFRPDRNAHGESVFFSFSDPNTIRSERRTRLIELPGTFKEVNTLKSKYPDAIVYTGKESTKSNFLKAYQNPNVEYIHLALHGIANSAEKDDIKLYFRTSDGGLDSLYGYELLRYKSKCKKIVLSACQSGLGAYQKGEGLFSLPRYFMINGATDMVFNYWDVED